MKMPDRFVSLSVLGVLVLSAVPALAEEFPEGDGPGKLFTAIEECIELETLTERRECVQELRDNAPRHRRGPNLENLPEELREAVEACKALDDREEMHECMKELREDNEDAFPAKSHFKRGQQKFGDRNGPGFGRGRGRGNGNGFLRTISDETRDLLQECREEESFTDRRECIRDVRESANNS